MTTTETPTMSYALPLAALLHRIDPEAIAEAQGVHDMLSERGERARDGFFEAMSQLAGPADDSVFDTAEWRAVEAAVHEYVDCGRLEGFRLGLALGAMAQADGLHADALAANTYAKASYETARSIDGEVLAR